MVRITKLFAMSLFLLFFAWITSAAAQAEESDDPQSTIAKEDCATLTEKNSKGETLTPPEGDALVLCFFPRDFSDDGVGPGFQAYQPPPSLYDLQDFNDIPGILGGGMVGG